ncbi:bacteriochlorophyll 4-vinyl reductase [Peteryoungia ipomoeae]|nr:bacteriochlorophyll 4-vinyl reductase [Peteryoungia ipomoeae]
MPSSEYGLGRLFDVEAKGTDAVEPSPARLGPNAIIQAGEVLSSRYGFGAASRIYEAAGLSRYIQTPPEALIDEREAQALFAAIRQALPAGEADKVLSEAGSRTAQYILKNRIPKTARQILPLLPSAIASRALVSAISRHAWTFSGSGRFAARVRGWRHPVPTLVIAGNPLATPGCPWHGAVFKGLFEALTSAHVVIAHARCCGRGNALCEWVIKAEKPNRSRSPKLLEAADARQDRAGHP